MTEDQVTTSGLQGTEAIRSVEGRHLLLVGAGPGLGLAIARRFASGGYHVNLIARSTDGLDKLVDRRCGQPRRCSVRT
jgi:short-subunit dehydrogenase